MGFLRLVTQGAVMGSSVLTQAAAWSTYNDLLSDFRVTFEPEPLQLESTFRNLSSRPVSAARLWTDDYLVAFAEVAGLQLVTLDQSMAARILSSLLLSP